MTSRTSHVLLVLTAFVAGLVIFSAAIFFVAGKGPAVQAPAPSAVGGPFRLVDHNGQTVTDTDMKGKPFLVFFGFTHCPDICPTTLFEVSEILGKLGGDAERVNALFVTVDPERDTADKLKDYLSSFHPRLRGLTGTSEAIAAMEKAYRVYSKKVPLDGGGYTMDHTALVYLMNKDGRFVAPFNMKRKPEEAAADLRKYL
ncbi:MAG: SCO family protein [Pseudorhodoplanes sp.]|jgi:protein SCO1/2|nr:SCO family protein [Pseudorhodoplanes sp.]